MMKFLVSIIFLIAFHCLWGQHSTSKLSVVKSYADAQHFIRQNPKSEGEIILVNSLDEDADKEKKLTELAQGDVITIDDYTYKVISTEKQLRLRSSYIFLDGNKLSAFSMDSIRVVVENRFENGTDFNQLVAEYSMDGMTDGDLGWAQEGVLLKEIEDAIKSHQVNDFFVVDIPEKKWYFIVVKTFGEKYVTESTVLKIKAVH